MRARSRTSANARSHTPLCPRTAPPQLKWSGTKYELVHRLTLPDDGSEYDEWDTAFTPASDGSAVAIFGLAHAAFQ